MSKRTLYDLKPGDSIHDMHYGLHEFVKKLEGMNLPYPFEVSHIRWEAKNGHRLIEGMVKNEYEKEEDCRFFYCNKLLVFISFDGDRHTFAYSYDGDRMGIVQVKRVSGP